MERLLPTNSNDDAEFKRQFEEAQDRARSLWLRDPFTSSFLKYLESEEHNTMVELRSALCMSPPNQDRAIRLAIRSKTLNEIIEYARRTRED